MGHTTRIFITLVLSLFQTFAYGYEKYEVYGQTPYNLPKEEAYSVAYANALAKLSQQVHGSVVRNSVVTRTQTMSRGGPEAVNQNTEKEIRLYNTGYLDPQITHVQYVPSMSDPDIGRYRLRLSYPREIVEE